MSLSTLPVVLAQAGGGAASTIPLMLGMFAIIYFVMIRPQQKQQKEKQTMLGALKKGDDVITSSGILGKVFAVDEKVVTIDVGSNVKVRMLKSSVEAKVTVEPRVEKTSSDSSEAKKEEK